MNRGIDLDLESLALDDVASYELLARGDTLGVFQLDGGPMRSLLKLMKPDNFEDISAVLALYRPGPMGANAHTDYALRKNKIQEVIPIHPELEEPLSEILAVPMPDRVPGAVMAVAQKLAGYTLGQADILRRAMGKKKKSELDKQFAGFSQGMQTTATRWLPSRPSGIILLPFSDYAFNKAHSAAYGVISYWTAYLKAHYARRSTMAALLTSVGDDKDKSAIYLNECRRMGITVLPPDVNESALNFTPVGTDIRFGMGAIRTSASTPSKPWWRPAKKEGAYPSFKDYLVKVPAVVCNKRTIESLIKAAPSTPPEPPPASPRHDP